jgi:hypothetical protein
MLILAMRGPKAYTRRLGKPMEIRRYNGLGFGSEPSAAGGGDENVLASEGDLD